MCGRFRLSRDEKEIAAHFDITEVIEWTPRYNIAPTQQIPTVRQNPVEPRREFTTMRWGLIPYWAKDASMGFSTFNAQSESAADKPAFREPMKKRRCLIPGDGFYEWQKLGPKEKQPYNFGLVDDGLFAFAGLWDRWRNPEGETIETCTILTTQPNALVTGIHNRMPVILKPEDYELWLDPGVNDAERVTELLKPLDAGLMRKYPVSARVGQVKNEDAECAKEIELPSVEQSGMLF
jgi:putative SOS response-associated peptidase YedK